MLVISHFIYKDKKSRIKPKKEKEKKHREKERIKDKEEEQLKGRNCVTKCRRKISKGQQQEQQKKIYTYLWTIFTIWRPCDHLKIMSHKKMSIPFFCVRGIRSGTNIYKKKPFILLSYLRTFMIGPSIKLHYETLYIIFAFFFIFIVFVTVIEQFCLSSF